MGQFLPKSAGKIVRGIVHLAPGEAVSRVCYAAIVIFLGHFYGGAWSSWVSTRWRQRFRSGCNPSSISA